MLFFHFIHLHLLQIVLQNHWNWVIRVSVAIAKGDERHDLDGVVTRAYVDVIHQSYLLLEEKLSTPAPSTASLQ